jgi:hypothetical protein
VSDRRAAARATAIAWLGIALVFVTQYAAVKPTNFGGYDEWLLLWLNRTGLLSFPHANRPLQQIWTVPALLFYPCSFVGYHVLHGLYLLLGGAMAFLLARRILGSGLLAYLAAVFAVAWAPLDMMRLATVQACIYSAVSFATLLALVLFARAIERENALLLAAGALVAFVGIRSYEGGLLLLMAAPLLLFFVDASSSSRRWRTRAVIAWEAVLAVALVLVAWPLVFRRPDAAYQSQVLAADWRPGPYLARLARQFWLSLSPLASPPLAELGRPSVIVAVAAFLAVAFVLLRARGPGGAPEPRGRLLRALAAGLVMAGLGYALIVASPQAVGATRTQILSAPGIALALAAVAGLATSWTASAARAVLALGLGSWVVAAGTAHTLAMQEAWDERSLYGAQVDSLRQLAAQAPVILPGTLVVLIDESGTWPKSFSFRHALAVLYPRDVVGHVLGADQVFYALVARPDGLESIPWPVLRGPWRTEPVHFPYDHIAVYRLTPDRRLVRLESWEDPRLPKLPRDARYAPGERVADGVPSDCARRLLGVAP